MIKTVYRPSLYYSKFHKIIWDPESKHSCQVLAMKIYFLQFSSKYQSNIYLLKAQYINTRKRCEICPNLTIKKPERQ